MVGNWKPTKKIFWVGFEGWRLHGIEKKREREVLRSQRQWQLARRQVESCINS